MWAGVQQHRFTVMTHLVSIMNYLYLFLCILVGRAGRVSKGFCYRLVSRHFWEHEIPDFTIPEMLVGERLHQSVAARLGKSSDIILF